MKNACILFVLEKGVRMMKEAIYVYAYTSLAVVNVCADATISCAAPVAIKNIASFRTISASKVVAASSP